MEASPTPSSDPLGMKMTISAVKMQFPKVKNIDTNSLEQWMNEGRLLSQTTTSESNNEMQEATAVVPGTRKQLVILDVRPEEEVAVSRIQSSIRVNPDETDMTKLEQIIDSNRTKNNIDDEVNPVKVVMYCSVGYRSSAMATKLQSALRKQEITNPIEIYNLEGSIFKWANEGKPIINGAGRPTEFVHPYNRVWGLLLDSYKRKYTVDT